jgi:hypothetical protein
MKKPVFTQPLYTLKEKVGSGGIPTYILKRCQEYIESNPVDFTPYAQRCLEQLKDIHARLEKKQMDPVAALGKISDLAMQLKANGSMFHYQLISMVSDVMLRFLDHVENINEDFVTILGMYNRILERIINRKLTGNGGTEGYALTQELHGACLRFYQKYGIAH